MSLQEFLNLLKKLNYLDRDKLENAGVLPRGDHNAWGTFKRNPYRFLIQAPDEIAQKIWEMIDESHCESYSPLRKKYEKRTEPENAEYERLFGCENPKS